MADDTAIQQRREENLQAMKSPASIVLAALGAVALVCATVFYDRPLANNNQLFSYLRSFAAIPADNVLPLFYIAHARSETIIDPGRRTGSRKDNTTHAL